MSGEKFDDGKLRWDLVPFKELEGMVKVITFGAAKYKDNGWKDVDPRRYKAAIMRHISAYMRGEIIDPESGLSHMSHVMTNALFLEWFCENTAGTLYGRD